MPNAFSDSLFLSTIFMSTTLQEGSKAPGFKAKDQNGNTVSLKDFKGKKLALYFYPHDNTPTCTTQACNIRDNFSILEKAGITVIGVSEDTEKSHKKFETKFQLPFPLLADPERKILEAYGVWGPKKFMGREFDGTHRTTFLINEKGIIEHIIEKVKSKEHVAQILEIWK
jgi:thioredoxin-dependent peroxiredoxin